MSGLSSPKRLGPSTPCHVRGATHLSWLLIAIATGGAWVFYFADAPTLRVSS